MKLHDKLKALYLWARNTYGRQTHKQQAAMINKAIWFYNPVFFWLHVTYWIYGDLLWRVYARKVTYPFKSVLLRSHGTNTLYLHLQTPASTELDQVVTYHDWFSALKSNNSWITWPLSFHLITRAKVYTLATKLAGVVICARGSTGKLQSCHRLIASLFSGC